MRLWGVPLAPRDAPPPVFLRMWAAEAVLIKTATRTATRSKIFDMLVVILLYYMSRTEEEETQSKKSVILF